MVAVPKSSQSSYWIEALYVIDSGDRFVVVPAHEHLAQTADTRSDLVRAGAVPDYVAQVENPVVLGRRSQARFQCFEVAMYIAEQENAH